MGDARHFKFSTEADRSEYKQTDHELPYKGECLLFRSRDSLQLLTPSVSVSGTMTTDPKPAIKRQNKSHRNCSLYTVNSDMLQTTRKKNKKNSYKGRQYSTAHSHLGKFTWQLFNNTVSSNVGIALKKTTTDSELHIYTQQPLEAVQPTNIIYTQLDHGLSIMPSPVHAHDQAHMTIRHTVTCRPYTDTMCRYIQAHAHCCYQKGKTNLDFTEARDSEWHWHQLGHMRVCTLLQTDNRPTTPPQHTTKFFIGPSAAQPTASKH